MTVQQASKTAVRRPTQAVILAGGRGTRLMPLTSDRPKPMVEFHGRPFLEYLIELLRDQGFERILLLLGYLPDVIADYFGDGRRWGVRIDYSVTDPDDLTTRRIQVAEGSLDPSFLLLYCDNYWPLQFDKMWATFQTLGAPAMVTVYSNTDGYSGSSVRVEDGFVTIFDRSRTCPDLQGVEISYAILTKQVLQLLPAEDELFEQALYPQLVARGQLGAYVTDHRYYSAGSPAKLPLTEAFFARRPAVILDRDGVLNRRPPRAEYVRSWHDFTWLPGTLEGLRLFSEAGYRVIVVSNQAGVARGVMTEADLAAIDARMRVEVERAGGRIDAVYYCTHGWDEGCACRKPRPGMLFQVQRDFHLDLTRTPFIGDDERDAAAADAAGCPSFLVTDRRPLLKLARELVGTTARR